MRTPTRPNDRQGRGRIAVPAFSPAAVEFLAARLAARGQITIAISRWYPFESKANRSASRHVVAPYQENEWSIDPADQSPLRRDRISTEQQLLWPFLRGRQSGGSECHPQIESRAQLREAFSGGIRMRTHTCKIDRCRSPCRMFVVVDANKRRSLNEAFTLRRLDDRSQGVSVSSIDVPRPLQPRMDGSGPRDGKSLDRLPATATPAFFPCR